MNNISVNIPKDFKSQAEKAILSQLTTALRRGGLSRISVTITPRGQAKFHGPTEDLAKIKDILKQAGFKIRD